MDQYETLVDTLVKIAEISRPGDEGDKRQNNIMHGICDLLEDAAVAIDDLMKMAKTETKELEAA
jgi:polyhydroxyalkanoate synthesis regulator phasin